MKYVVLFLLIVGANTMMAQSQFVGGVFGMNATFVAGESIWKGAGKIGLRTGITYAYFGKDDFLFEIGGIYEQKGFKEINESTGETVIHSMDYLSYPVKFGMVVRGTTAGYAAFKFGLVPAILINSANNAGQATIETDKPVFDLGAAADFALGYIFNEKIDLYMKVGYQQSFFMSQPNFLPQERLFNGSVDISMGVRYRIPM